MPPKTPTLHDVAQFAGVSATTVSRVLNNRGYLSEATRAKVYSAIEKLNYQPNALARSLRDQRTYMVGIIVPTIAHPFYGHMAKELEGRFAQAGYRVLLCNSEGQPEVEKSLLEMLVAHQVDGIVTGSHSDQSISADAIRAPLVSLDQPSSAGHPAVRCQNFAGAKAATLGLTERGAKRVAHLTSSRQGTNSKRALGYLEAVQENGLEPILMQVKRHEIWQEDSAAVFAELDAKFAQTAFDAIFCGNDNLAATALEWARIRGIAVPQQLQILGFDGANATRQLRPELSTVVQPYEIMADKAVDLILNPLEGALPDEQAAASSAKQETVASSGAKMTAPAFEFPADIHWGGTTR